MPNPVKKKAAPRSTGFAKDGLDVEGLLLLWKDDRPILVLIDGLDGWCLPIFSSIANLEHAAKAFGLQYETIKEVTGPEFCDAAWEGGIRIVLDPYKATSGAVRYLEVSPSPKGAN